VTDAGGFSAFYARYPQLCGGSRRLDATPATGVGDDVMAGALTGCDDSVGGGGQVVTPSDNALLGHVSDQVMTSVQVS